ncbi:T9SS type A sorting domain-containing protein [Ferruginibacter profundus]
MKQVYKSCLVFLMALSASALLLTSCHRSEGEEEENDEYDGPDKAVQFEIERTRDLSTGKVPWEKLRIAMEQTEQSKMSSSNLINSLSWIERGPNGDFTGPQGNGRQNNDQTAGRIRAAMIDSLDATHKTVWVGGIDGGLWKTTDITASPANWVLVNDFLANLAVSAICQDPRPGFQNNMYFCTGESYFNADAVRGVGVYKSTDGGLTWNFLASTSTYLNGTRILCDYQGNVYLGTRGSGLLRSTNGGSTWTNITPSGLNNDIADLEISSTAVAGRLHVTTGIFSASGYRYTDNPETATSATWTTATTPFTTFSQRTEMAINGNTLYALPDNASHQVPTIWKSTDGGANWASTTGQPATNWASGQGWYSLSCAINPANPNECIVGGLDCYKTSDGGTTWPKISAWVTGAGSSQYVHADQHNVQWWDGGTKIMFTSDGGVFYTSDGAVTIRDRNKGLRLKQFYSVAIHPGSTNYFIAGAQDNGVHRLDHPGLDSSIEVYGGDGCYVAIDQNEPQYQFGSYVYNVYRRSTNNGASWSTPVNNQSTGRFVNPWDYDNNANIIYACNAAGNYLRWDNPQTGNTTTVISMAAFNGGNVSAVHASPYTANRVYFGTGSGAIAAVDNANTATPTGTTINTGAGMPAGYVNCVVTGSDDQHLLATFTNYGIQNVWVTTNGGTTWTAIDGNLPDMPVRWALFHPDTDTKAYIATETGVWETDLINGAATVWTANPTFPNVRTDMIKYRSSDRTIAAGTHGRGIWSAVIPSGCTSASITSQPANATICATNNATFTIAGTGTGYQWQVSINGGGSWTDVANGGVYSGATTTSLTITGATAGMNGYQYRCVATGSCAPTSATSNAGILTVNAATSITSQPAASAICAGTNTSFTVAATGASLTYQWQESTNGGGTWGNILNGGIYSGATGVTLTLTGVTAVMNNNQYRCVIGSACTPLNSNAAILTVNAAPSVTAQPLNSSVCAGNAATFSVTGAGGGLTYQWQESTNGGGSWNNLTNGAPYSGVLTATLNINPTTVGMNAYQYRCVINGSCPGSATSNAGTLTVGTALSITSQPLSTIVCAGSTTSYSVATTGTVISYQWQESTNGGGIWNNVTNGGVYSGATTVTLTLTGVTAGMNNNQYRCVVTGSCPAINSSAATLTVNTAPNITAQPVSSIVCATQNTSFTTVATGTAVTYQWQESTTGCAGTFTNVVNGGVYSGATTATLSITGAPATMNGYAYKCVITGTCTPAATSACVTLTVNTPVAITAQPLASVVCAGSTTTFGVTATGTSPTYQWQESTNGGGTWNNIANGGVYSGATTATLTLTGVTAGMTTYQYRCIVSGATSCGAVNSTAGILTVNTAPAITTQPVAGTTICAGQNTSYGVVANGTALTYQWQLSTDNGTTWNAVTNGGVYSGATTATLSITAATVTMNTYRYRCVISGTCTPAVNSTASILTVYTPISITTPPAAATICATGTTSFSVVAAGTSPTLQWQESTNGGTTWNNIANGGIYSGATTATLTLTGVTAGMNGYLYRTVVSGLAPCGAVNTVSAALTVSAQPTVTLTASPYTKLLPGLTTTITASVTPATGFTTVWTRNGTPISVVGNSVNVSVNELGLYTVVATIGSCISVPATITISDSASSKLFIYPSPNNGQFTVAYYNQGGSTTKQIVTIYSSKGERVYNNEFPVTQAYQLLKVDLRRNGSGVYYVVLSDSNGKVIKRGEVLVR